MARPKKNEKTSGSEKKSPKQSNKNSKNEEKE